ncbi:MAG: transketolase [Propionibacteriaceae bacterium]
MTDIQRRLPESFTEHDAKAIDTARTLTMDAVQNIGSGHPGTAMSLAPLAYLLYQDTMTHDPSDPTWLGRDRFVLSNGHSSLTQYCQLFLGGFGLELEDIKALRTWGSKTPGHPEYGHTAGVETTTGPLGQGIANAVGMAMAARRERGLFDPEAAAGESIFDHHIYVVAGDGCLQEGVSAEASSLAGTQELGNLTLIWDDNRISIEDDTVIAFTEDVCARYRSYGWHVLEVDWTQTGDYVEDLVALQAALAEAKAVTDKPSFIRLRTIIGWPAPTLRNTGKIHGSTLGAAEISATKEILGMPDEAFHVEADVLARSRELIARGKAAHQAWDLRYQTWRQNNPERAALLDRMNSRILPSGWDSNLPFYEADAKGKATRAASGDFLSAVAEALPELWGGSADLAGSNNTTMKGQPSFLPEDRQSATFTGGSYGRTLHFGIREHAMGAIMNGILEHGGTRVYGGTFAVFSDYMRPPARLAALMNLPAIYVWTHDSIGVGEDGPTHQPIEHLTALRAIPGLDVVRPADANETVACWVAALENSERPTALILSRQELPIVPRGTAGFATTDQVSRGAYTLLDTDGTPDVILLASGSEVQLAVAATEILAAEGIKARVVSVPCQEWFANQPTSYREQVLPAGVKARVSVEAGIAMSWRHLIGDAGEAVSIEHFGASAPATELFERFGFTAQAVADAAKKSINKINH